MDSFRKSEMQSEILNLYSTVHFRRQMFEYKYEKMCAKLIQHLLDIYDSILVKEIDLFERGVEDCIRKQRHQEGVIIKLSEGQKKCKNSEKCLQNISLH